jgi:hypothetical protein
VNNLAFERKPAVPKAHHCRKVIKSICASKRFALIFVESYSLDRDVSTKTPVFQDCDALDLSAYHRIRKDAEASLCPGTTIEVQFVADFYRYLAITADCVTLPCRSNGFDELWFEVQKRHGYLLSVSRNAAQIKTKMTASTIL